MTNIKANALLFAFLLAPTLGGCSSDSRDTPPIEDRADARVALDAIVLRLNGLDPKSANLAPQREDVFRAFEVALDVDGDIGCLSGGSLTFDGQAEGSADFEEQMASFDVHIDFDMCKVEDVVVDGGLSHTATVVREDGMTAVDYDYAGLLVFDGAVEGSCAFDFSAHVEREPGSISATTTYSGDFCGFKAPDLGVSVQLDIDD